jgi:uncharacterized protein (DUF934 family)
MVTKGKRAEIACILCKNAIRFPEYIGQDYSGDLLCDTCNSLLRIKLDKWEVKEFKVLEDRLEQWKGIEKLRQLREAGAGALAKPKKSRKAGGE